jgi:hypothetical protein
MVYSLEVVPLHLPTQWLRLRALHNFIFRMCGSCMAFHSQPYWIEDHSLWRNSCANSIVYWGSPSWPPQHITHSPMDRPNTWTKSSNNIFVSLWTNVRVIGIPYYHWANLHRITMSTLRCSILPSSSTLAETHRWGSNLINVPPNSKLSTNLSTGWNQRWGMGSLSKVKGQWVINTRGIWQEGKDSRLLIARSREHMNSFKIMKCRKTGCYINGAMSSTM